MVLNQISYTSTPYYLGNVLLLHFVGVPISCADPEGGTLQSNLGPAGGGAGFFMPCHLLAA